MKRPPTIRLLATVVALAALATAGCSTMKGGGVDPTLTESRARSEIQTYLTQTLADLPPGTRLSIQPQNPELAALTPNAVVAPCTWDNAVDHSPVSLSVGYWVTGVPTGMDLQYLDAVLTSWTRRGATISFDRRPRDPSVSLASPHGYGLSVQAVPEKPGSLSINMESPCFPESARGTTTPYPTVVDHPGGN